LKENTNQRANTTQARVRSSFDLRQEQQTNHPQKNKINKNKKTKYLRVPNGYSKEKVKMAAMDQILNTFIDENGLADDIKEPIIELMEKCFMVYTKALIQEYKPETTMENNKVTMSTKQTVKSSKHTKKIETPTEATCLEDLRSCTSVSLNDFCKQNEIRVGGNKKDVMERVWRFLSGETLEDDNTSVSKKKKPSTKKEHNVCSCTNKKGKPCALSGTEEMNGKWYCFRHFEEAPKKSINTELDEEE